MLGRLRTIPTERTQKLFGVNLRRDSNLKLISVLHDFICVNISRRTQKILTISFLGANYRPKNANPRFYKKGAHNTNSNIMQHGSVYIQCAHKGKWTTLKFFVVTTEGLTIIGLPSLRNLELISLHCTIEEDKGPINSIVELTNSYPNQFDRI